MGWSLGVVSASVPTTSEGPHPAANANQVPNEKRTEVSKTPAHSEISGNLSKPPPSACRPPHRGEYKRVRLTLRAIVPRLSLKLSLPVFKNRR